MTKEAFLNMPKGTKLLVGHEFMIGDDDRIEEFLGKVVTFDHFDGMKWVYFKEGPTGNPFRYDEIECVADHTIDQVSKYEVGDMNIIFGEVG